jgi:hypothetical protein
MQRKKIMRKQFRGYFTNLIYMANWHKETDDFGVYYWNSHGTWTWIGDAESLGESERLINKRELAISGGDTVML